MGSRCASFPLLDNDDDVDDDGEDRRRARQKNDMARRANKN